MVIYRLEVEDPNWCPESDLYDFDDTNYNNTKNSERNDDDNSDEQNDSHSNIKSFYESKKSTKKIVKLNSSNCSNKSKFDQIINEKNRNSNKAISRKYDSENESNDNNSTLFYY